MDPQRRPRDEITEQFPLEQSEGFDGDSGASRAVMGQLLTSLSDESRRGRALLVATTNCPWRIGAAMRSRFTVIPVLHPLEEDFPGILASIAEQVKSRPVRPTGRFGERGSKDLLREGR